MTPAPKSTAAAPSMSWWEARVVPHLVDLALSQPPVDRYRRSVCDGLTGRVIEVGFGSGLNLPHVGEVASIDAVEPSDLGWERSARRRAGASVPISRIGLDGQHLAAEDASYDAALCTFSLCTIPDAALALRELHRVLKPGAALHFLEHGLAPTPRLARWQHRLDPLEQRLFGGCHLTRDAATLVGESGLRITEVEHGFLGGRPSPWGYLTWGRAVRA